MSEYLLRPSQITQLSNLELIARQVVEGFIVGLHKSPFHGFSVEFAEHRLYNVGENPRTIDWKVYARTDKMFTKRFEEETNLRCQIVLDASSSMYFPEDAGEKGKPTINKLNFSAVSAAAIMHMLKKQRDAVGLTVFSDVVEFQTREKSTTMHHNLLISQMESLLQRKTRNKGTAAARCLHQIADAIHRRSLVVIFSDMFENNESAEDIFAALQHLRYNKHEVVLFHVTDKQREQDFEFENRPYIFIDMETGEEVRLQPSQVKAYYTEKMGEFTQNLKLRCGQFDIDFVEADINKDFKQVLLPYLLKRNAML